MWKPQTSLLALSAAVLVIALNLALLRQLTGFDDPHLWSSVLSLLPGDFIAIQIGLEIARRGRALRAGSAIQRLDKVEGIDPVERVAVTFQIGGTLVEFPFPTFQVKVMEQRDGSYVGVPNVAVLSLDGSPDWITGLGGTVEEALKNALDRLVNSLADRRDLPESCFVWRDPLDSRGEDQPMQLPRPRFTIRRLMIAVAILAVLLASTIQAIRLSRLASRYQAEGQQAAFWEATARQRASLQEDVEKTHLKNLRLAREELAKPMYRAPEWKEFLSSPDPLGMKFHEANARDSATKAGAEKRLAAYWQERKNRYERAARYPWESVEPDPPVPK